MTPAAELRQAAARLREPGQTHVAPAVAEPSLDPAWRQEVW